LAIEEAVEEQAPAKKRTATRPRGVRARQAEGVPTALLTGGTPLDGGGSLATAGENAPVAVADAVAGDGGGEAVAAAEPHPRPRTRKPRVAAAAEAVVDAALPSASGVDEGTAAVEPVASAEPGAVPVAPSVPEQRSPLPIPPDAGEGPSEPSVAEPTQNGASPEVVVAAHDAPAIVLPPAELPVRRSDRGDGFREPRPEGGSRRDRRRGRGPRPEGGERQNGVEPHPGDRPAPQGDGRDPRFQQGQRPRPQHQQHPPQTRSGAPYLTMTDLDAKEPEELLELARSFEIQGIARLPRQELQIRILRGQTEKDGNVFGDGVLEIIEDGFGFLRGQRFLPGPDDIYVSQSQIRRFGLRTGDRVVGQVRPPKDNEKFYSLLRVEAVNGVDADTARRRPSFDSLTPIFPLELINLETAPNILSTRLLNLVAPIGRGSAG